MLADILEAMCRKPTGKFQTFGLGLTRLLFIVSVAAPVASAKAQGSEARCQEATSLWMPLQTNVGLPGVTKWESSIGYTIVSPDQNHTTSITNALETVAQESRLSIAPASGFGINLFIAVPPDIAAFGTPAGEKGVEDFFTDFYRQKGLSANASENNSAIWGQKFRDAKPRCLGITFTVHKGRIERAFLAVQADETPACIKVGLGEIFGLVNIRNYFFSHDMIVSTDLLALAFRTLYSAGIEAGTSQSEAANQIEKLCK
jgi:hypothetical protein